METKYYTPKEARELLGITHSALLNQVVAGNLHRIIPPGKRQGVYLKGEVDQLKREMETFFATRRSVDPIPTQLHRANVEHLPAVAEIANLVFEDTNKAPLDNQTEWQSTNPDINLVLNQDGKIVGLVQLIPLRPHTINDLLTGKRKAADLTSNDILVYSPGQIVNLFIMGIGTLTEDSLTQRRKWGQRLVKGTYDLIIDLAERGIVIEEIRAHTSKADCARLLRNAGFLETPPRMAGFRDFLMPIVASGAPWVMAYKRALQDQQNQRIDTNSDTSKDNERQTVAND